MTKSTMTDKQIVQIVINLLDSTLADIPPRTADQIVLQCINLLKNLL